jgi:hypothetical protein
MSTHLFPEVAMHLIRVTETAHWLEWQDWANPVLAWPFRQKGGHLLITEAIRGYGLEAREATPFYRLARTPMPAAARWCQSGPMVCTRVPERWPPSMAIADVA